MIAIRLLESLPDLRKVLTDDVQAAFEGDPAAKNLDEIIFCYPGLAAITVFRIAHELHQLGVPLIPRMMTEYAHSKTGIDIHPGATIGRRFFIDHGTGVVIGETTHIGEDVKIYQGVTLGALSFPRDESRRTSSATSKRHPTIEDDVVIYANATILGGKTVIGHHSVVGSSAWITRSIAPYTTVTIERPHASATGAASRPTRTSLFAARLPDLSIRRTRQMARRSRKRRSILPPGPMRDATRAPGDRPGMRRAVDRRAITSSIRNPAPARRSVAASSPQR